MVDIIPPDLFKIFADTYSLLGVFAPYLVPIASLAVFLIVWKKYVVAVYIHKMKWVLLEIRLPQEVEKSPQAMEIALTILHQTSKGKWFAQWWEGKIRPWFSLEIVSIEGSVHFFIYTQKFHSKLIQSHFYSQYPNIEIHEVDDYTNKVPFKQKGADWDVWGGEFKHTQNDAYPIRTYIDYELDKKGSREESEKVDPLTPFIEFFGSIGKGEQLWFQILVRASEKRYGKTWWDKGRDWKGEGDELVKKLRKADAKPGQIVVHTTKLLSPGEERIVKSIQRGLSKIAFDCGIRAIYLARKNSYNIYNRPGLISAFKQYNSEDMNGFKPNGKYMTDFDFPWEDFMGMRLAKRKIKLFNAYKLRSYFHPPHERTPIVLSSEELATIYHFPGKVVTTPTVHRLPSRTGEPPRDLPK